MCAPVAVTAGGALTTWAPMLPGYLAAFVALVSLLAVNYRSSLKKLISKAQPAVLVVREAFRHQKMRGWPQSPSLSFIFFLFKSFKSIQCNTLLEETSNQISVLSSLTSSRRFLNTCLLHVLVLCITFRDFNCPK